MRNLIFLFSLTFLFNGLMAQDTLYKSDGTRLAVRIIDTNLTSIRYNEYSDSIRPAFVIDKNFVTKIVFASGEIALFSKNELPIPIGKIAKTDANSAIFKRNMLSLNASDLLFGLLTFGYEYTLKSGNYSLSWPISTGINSIVPTANDQSRNGYLSRERIFGTGFGFNFYPDGQGSAAFYMGTAIEYGVYNALNYYYDPVSATSVERKVVSTEYGIIFKGGVSCQWGNHFDVNLNAGLGYARTKDYYNWHGKLAIRGEINIGYKF